MLAGCNARYTLTTLFKTANAANIAAGNGGIFDDEVNEARLADGYKAGCDFREGNRIRVLWKTIKPHLNGPNNISFIIGFVSGIYGW